ncbi:MAG: hypothetical protein IAG13_14705 [Deltaproteobacteria bacterium]|nr:hypothetical protein [Nannocystaceae bacterium]
MVLAFGGIGWAAWRWARPQDAAGEAGEIIIRGPVQLQIDELRIGGSDGGDEDDAPPVEDAPPAAPPRAIEAAPAQLAAEKREALHALSDTVRGGVVGNPDAFDGLSDASEVELFTAMVGGVLAKEAEVDASPGGFVEPPWDGKEPLVCGMGDKWIIRDKTIDVQGVAITTMAGCRLHLVDCDITADIGLIVMMRSEASVQGGTMRPRMGFAQQLYGQLSLTGVEVLGDNVFAIDIGNGRTVISDSKISGKTAVRASGAAQVRIVDSTLTGTTAALDVGGTANVELTGGAQLGTVEKGRTATVVELPH